MHIWATLFTALLGRRLSFSSRDGPFNLLKLNLEFIHRCNELPQYIVDNTTRANYEYLCRNNYFNEIFSETANICNRYGLNNPNHQVSNGSALAVIFYSDKTRIMTTTYPVFKYKQVLDESTFLIKDVHSLRYQNSDPLRDITREDNNTPAKYFHHVSSQRHLNETLQTGSLVPLGRTLTTLEKKVCAGYPNTGCNITHWQLHSCRSNSSQPGGFSLEILIPTNAIKPASSSFLRFAPFNR